MKTCSICKKEIPEDFINPLCLDCYGEIEKENARKQALEEEERQKTEKVSTTEPATPEQPVLSERSGITNPDYQENPEMEDKEQWKTNFALFERHGVMIWKPTRQIYTYIKNYCLEKIKLHPQFPKFIWRPKIVDVGCGTGVGSNVLSQETDFVWGIDKNHKTIMFAKECFERIKNNIYYSGQVSFDEIDIMVDTREFLKFDLVVAVEIIEHIDDYKKFLTTLIQKFDKKKGGYEATEYFISTPNRNNKHIRKDKPYNQFHVREWSSEEFWDVLSEFFNNIEFFAADGKPTEKSSEHTPLLARTSLPKI